MLSIERSFFTQHPHCLCYFSLFIERSVLMALVFCQKDVLEKVTMQRTQQFSTFLCYRKNPVKCSARTVARKIDTDCLYIFLIAETCRFLTMPSLEIQENLQNNSSETTWMIYHKNSEFWNREFSIIQNVQWKRFPANYENRLCQNFIITVLTERI